MDTKYKMMTEQLKLTNSNEEVASFLRWIVESGTAKNYWEQKLKINNVLTKIGVTDQFPNIDDLLKLKTLLKFKDKYEISIQFWPEQTAVYISKDGVDLIDFGGDFDFAIDKSIEYLNKITNHNKKSI